MIEIKRKTTTNGPPKLSKASTARLQFLMGRKAKNAHHIDQSRENLKECLDVLPPDLNTMLMITDDSIQGIRK